MDKRTTAISIVLRALQAVMSIDEAAAPQQWMSLGTLPLLEEPGDRDAFLEILLDGRPFGGSFPHLYRDIEQQILSPGCTLGTIVDTVEFLMTHEPESRPPLLERGYGAPTPSASAPAPPLLRQAPRPAIVRPAAVPPQSQNDPILPSRSPEPQKTRIQNSSIHSGSVMASPPPSMATRQSNTTVNQLNSTVVKVFYATDRLKIPSLRDGISFTKNRSLLATVHLGECEVSIPKTHRIGKLETPSILRFEFRPNPEKHIVLIKTRSLDEEQFIRNVALAVEQSISREIFIFVHGYNVSFQDAARRTGQMAYDLAFSGAPVFYSWPSSGKAYDYIKDETNSKWSTPHFERFLQLISQKTGANRIHVIAHSMGNRVVCDALEGMSRDPQLSLKLTHLVLAAPDIDAETFVSLARHLRQLSKRVTLYESSNDKALHASKKIHGYARAGEPLLIIPGLDTVDASAVDTDFLGHSYFSDNWALLSDIHAVLSKDLAPEERFGLTRFEHLAGKYYAFRK